MQLWYGRHVLPLSLTLLSFCLSNEIAPHTNTQKKQQAPSEGQANCLKAPHILYYLKKEEKAMQKNEPEVQCIFSSESKSLPELLQESFRLYLSRILTENTAQAR